MEKEILYKKVGAKIKSIRQAKGLSLMDVVGKIEGGIDKSNLSRIEAGRTNPTVHTLYRLSIALEVSLKELVDVDLS